MKIINLKKFHDLSIPIDPNKKSPSFYDKDPLKIKYYNDSKKIWGIKKGSTCNIPVINLNIHCGSTHTECRSHITKESLNISEIIKDSFIPTILISVKPTENIGDGICGLCLGEIEYDSNSGIFLPVQSELSSPYPNPFGGTTSINFGIDSETYTTIYIMNTDYNMIDTLIQYTLHGGGYYVR